MKELIKFSIKRRFINKATLFFNVLFLLITIVVFNVDKVMAVIQPEINSQLAVKTEASDLKRYINLKNDKVTYSDKADITIKQTGNTYEVNSEYGLNAYQTQAIVEILEGYFDSKPKSEEDQYHLAYFYENLSLNIEFKTTTVAKENKNTVFAFMVVTTIYFMMISFSSMSANEVVYEKSTKLLETILTTLSVSEHFYGKMLIGWLNIIIQTLLSGIIVGSVFIWRYTYDKGTKLCDCLHKLDLLDNGVKSLQDLSKWLSIDGKFMIDMFLIMVILMLGIVSVQVIMVSISSFVSNIEEAGNIQSPMYILFMGLYYFSLSLNQPAQLEKGLGKLCSYLPITSMLFMPYRIMLTKVKYSLVFTGIGINALFLGLCLVVGRYLYGKGILYQKSNRIRSSTSKPTYYQTGK